MALLSNIFWIDQNLKDKKELNRDENKDYLNQLYYLGSFKIKCFKDVNKSKIYLKSIKYEETFIIVSGRLYTELIENLIKNYSELYIIPIIIIFTYNKDKFKKINKDFMNNKYYSFGHIYTKFIDLKKFILKSSKNYEIFINEEDTRIIRFEYIDNKEKLILPILSNSFKYYAFATK